MQVPTYPLLLLPLSLLLLHSVAPVHGGHALVFPGEFSHWLNMRTIIEELVKKNHSVTILVPDASPTVNYNNSRDAAKFNFLVFKVTLAVIQRVCSLTENRKKSKETQIDQKNRINSSELKYTIQGFRSYSVSDFPRKPR